MESFLIHMRSILEFLKPIVVRGTDIISEYYMSDEDYKKMNVEIDGLLSSEELKKLRKRVNTELAHLSFDRNKLDYKSKLLGHIHIQFGYFGNAFNAHLGEICQSTIADRG